MRGWLGRRRAEARRSESKRVHDAQAGEYEGAMAVVRQSLAELDGWLGRYRVMWEHHLDALHTEVARGKRERRSTR